MSAASGVLGCGCPTGPHRSVTDEVRHAAYHRLVAEQGGPTGTVDADTLRAARGFQTGTLHGETILDQRARATGKRASGELRRASR